MLISALKYVDRSSIAEYTRFFFFIFFLHENSTRVHRDLLLIVRSEPRSYKSIKVPTNFVTANVVNPSNNFSRQYWPTAKQTHLLNFCFLLALYPCHNTTRKSSTSFICMHVLTLRNSFQRNYICEHSIVNFCALNILRNLVISCSLINCEGNLFVGHRN